jgi:esterase/lipase
MKRFVKGDGHPVLFLPGFGGSDASTAPMRKLLQDLGYQTYGWGLGRNLFFDDDLEKEMVAMLDEMYAKHGRKISIVGWSLGGLYAREIAKVNPDVVRHVISLGSPISGRYRHSDASHLYRAINGPPSAQEQLRRQAVNAPPPVPTTSIYSKTDGVVSWEGSVQRHYEELDNSDQVENIEVPASHIGLGFNALVMYVLADRLSQKEGQWKPFETSTLTKLIFRKPSKETTARRSTSADFVIS